MFRQTKKTGDIQYLMLLSDSHLTSPANDEASAAQTPVKDDGRDRMFDSARRIFSRARQNRLRKASAVL